MYIHDIINYNPSAVNIAYDMNNFFVVIGITAGVVEALLPIMNGIKEELKNDLTNLKETVDQQYEVIKCLNETVKTLAGEFEEHKDELDDTQASIQSIIDNPPTDEISRRVLQLLLPYLNNIEEEIKTDIGQLISETATSTEIILRDELMEYKNQTTSELADLQSSINANLSCVKTDLADLQSSINTNFSCVKTDLADLQSSINANLGCVKTDLADLQSSINANLSCVKTDLADLQSSINANFSCVKTDLADLQSSINANLSCVKTDLADLQSSVDSVNDTLNHINDTNTDQLMKLCVKMDTLQEELHSIDTRISNNITQVNATISSELTSYNIKLDLMNKLFSDDFNDVKTELSGINDTTNEIVDEIEDHDKQTGTKLMDIESLICDSHDVGCCGSASRGWRRVVYLDMTDPNTNCPSGWSMTNYNIRTCGRASDGYDTCDSVFFPVSGGEYSQVCGKMKAYQWGLTAGFIRYNGYSTVNDSYFSGVAVLHGSPQQHIWSFVAGALESYPSYYQALCPCDTSYNIAIPSFVGDDYFCESGYIYPGVFNSSEVYSLHSDDPLWDGDGCHSSSTCCTFNNPPYFTKYLDNPTTDDIELRLCCYRSLYRENIAVELVEIYVK